MKKKVFSLMMMCLFAFTGMMSAQTLVVNDGTSENAFVPVDGFRVDRYQKVEFVQPAADLADLVDGEITELQFSVSTWATRAWDDCNI